MKTIATVEAGKLANPNSGVRQIRTILGRLALGVSLSIIAATSASATETTLVASVAAVTSPGINGSAQELAAIAVEDSYISTTRNYLASVARYPTGREPSLHRPQGQVAIWFELDREGQVNEARIEKSSASMILDNAAIATVRRGKYPALPADFHPADRSHGFLVTFNYGAHVPD
jgi:protein TonB